MKNKSVLRQLLTPAVIVAALGYFVDIYDLLLFNIVRIPSLRAIGLEGQELQAGAWLHNIQMTGMMIGGVLWGVLGDKRGRLSVLFGSIILYSVANFANGFVTTFNQYAVLRFFAGMGLAGELGAGITLVAETLPVHLRGYGTMVVATVGVSGAVVAGIVGDVFDWRTSYIIGGVLGFLLLLLRIGVVESGMFASIHQSSNVEKGNFFQFFSNAKRAVRYLRCIMIGVPIWYVIGIPVAFAPEIAVALGVTEPIKTSRSVMFCYIGLILGDFLSGAISQLLKSRKKAVLLFLLFTGSMIAVYYSYRGHTPNMFYLFCMLLGLGAGYWAVFVTIAVEQFGTNLRATAGTSVPNFVRGSIVPMSLSFIALKPGVGILEAGMIVGAAAMGIAFLGLYGMRETFGENLDFLEK